MNKSTSLRRTAIAAAALALLAVGQSASAGGFSGGVTVALGDVNYVGSDGNWFNPANWSSGRVPGANDNVILDGDDRVVIDPTLDPAGYTRVTFGDLVISSVASLEVLPGAVVRSRNQIVADRGQLIFRASGDVSESLVVAPGTKAVTLVQNPNPKNKRFIVLQSSTSSSMGLGGTAPASVTRDATGADQLAAGPGHYATMTVDTLIIDGELSLSTYYGFSPRPGQSFQIATVNGTRRGEFLGIPEGGYVGCTDDNVGLRLSYEGGDGNDLVISAEQTEPGICLLLPAVQKVREAASRMHKPAVDETAQTREHILLARQTQIALPADDGETEGKTKMPSPTTPISGPKPPKK